MSDYVDPQHDGTDPQIQHIPSPSTGIAVNADTRVDESLLATVNNFDDAQTLFDTLGVVPEDFADYGNGFSVVDDKSKLVGVPFIIVDWRFNRGTYGDFVTAFIITQNNEKLILNDGSTGIRKQLDDVTATRVRQGKMENSQKGLYVRGGLTMSKYDYRDDKGNTIPAVTYYLSGTAEKK